MNPPLRADMFKVASRQEFRRYFQPSRVLLAVLPAPSPSGVNVVTLCFHMYCSYRPPMMAVAIQKGSWSFDLMKETQEYVLAVPGAELLDAAMGCGVTSGRDVDKVTEFGLDLLPSTRIATPGIGQAIANVELRREHLLSTGDHVLAVGRVLRFSVRPDSRDEPPLLSIGPRTDGYTVLAHKRIHRLAIARRE